MSKIVHESPSPSLSDALEYSFPLTEAGEGGVPLAVLSLIGRDRASAEIVFAQRLANIKTPEVREFAHLFDGMLPCSVMVQGESCWLVLKRARDFQSSTQFGKAIMVPALPQWLEWPPGLNPALEKSPYMLEFLEQFGGLTIHVPPAGCCMSCSDRPFVMREKDFPGLGEWDGSLAFFYPGDGDVMLARPDGSTGVWQHEFSADYDQNKGSGLFGTIFNSLQAFLPSDPEPKSLPPDCVAKLDNNILIEIRKEIENLMTLA